MKKIKMKKVVVHDIYALIERWHAQDEKHNSFLCLLTDDSTEDLHVGMAVSNREKFFTFLNAYLESAKRRGWFAELELAMLFIEEALMDVREKTEFKADMTH